MTNTEFKKKYPIGTKVKYVGYPIQSSEIAKDMGRVGKVVRYHCGNPIIFLPESTHISFLSTSEIPASWETDWEGLEIVSQKNQQLLFSFME